MPEIVNVVDADRLGYGNVFRDFIREEVSRADVNPGDSPRQRTSIAKRLLG